MWERIAGSSEVFFGAVALFALFTLVLFVYEKKAAKSRQKKTDKKSAPYLVHKAKNDKAA